MGGSVCRRYGKTKAKCTEVREKQVVSVCGKEGMTGYGGQEETRG